MVKNLPANARDANLIPRSGRSPGEGNSQSIPIFLPGKSHGQSPWGRKESDTTEHVQFSFYFEDFFLNDEPCFF